MKLNFIICHHTETQILLQIKEDKNVENSIRQCQKLNPDQRIAHIFGNTFTPTRKSQNNPDQSAFHLPAAHIDVQPMVLMAVLEENKTTAVVAETVPHTRVAMGIVK